MFCEKCGAVLPQNAKFCGACGSAVFPKVDNATVLMSAPSGVDKETVFMSAQSSTAKAPAPTIAPTAANHPAAIMPQPKRAKKKKGAVGFVLVGLLIAALAIMLMKQALSQSDNGSMEAAQGFYSRGEYAQAIQEYDKLLVSDKTSPEIYLGKAQALIVMGDKAAAKEVLNEGFRRTGSDEIWQMIQSMEE